MIDFLNSCTDLIACILDLDFLNLWLFPMIALAFVATVPAIVRYLISWR